MRSHRTQSHPWLSTVLAIAVVVALGCMGVLRLALASNSPAPPPGGSSLNTANDSAGTPGQQLPVQPAGTPAAASPAIISATPEGPCDYVVPAVLGPSAPPHPVIVNGTQVPIKVLTPTISLSANPAQPAVYDDLRVIPVPYLQPLHHTLTPCPPQSPNAKETRTVAPAVIKGSPLYAEPEYVPQGYNLTSLAGWGRVGAEVDVDLTYRGPGPDIVVSRSRLPYTPFDVYMRTDASSALAMAAQSVGGHTAFVEYPRTGSGHARVLFARSGILTTVESEGGKIQDLINVAASLP